MIESEWAGCLRHMAWLEETLLGQGEVGDL